MDWRHRAACRDHDPELFSPVGDSGAAVAQTAKAKAVCAGCTVRNPCLDDAIAMGDDHTIRGGTTAKERRNTRTRTR